MTGMVMSQDGVWAMVLEVYQSPLDNQPKMGANQPEIRLKARVVVNR